MSNALSSIDHSIACVVLATFVLTFLVARITVLLIMLRWIPTLYFRVQGTHVHHLNYGIFLLSFVGGFLLLAHPTGSALVFAAILYGIGLALTFDEFGMWLHLGGPYWQRASFDAIVTIAALLALIVFAPDIARFRPAHWTTAILLLALLSLFITVLLASLRFANNRISPLLQNIESRGPAE